MQITEGVALYITDNNGLFLSVKRADNDESLPGTWGLPTTSVRAGETPEQAIVRAAHDKLGIDVNLKGFVGEDSRQDKTGRLHMREYEVKIADGDIELKMTDPTVSSYSEFRWTSDFESLRPAAMKGSLCTRILLQHEGLISG